MLDQAIISLSDKCDVGCKFCFRADRGTESMTIERAARIFSRLRELGMNEVCFTGGEPTDHPLFLDFTKVALQFGLLPSVVTSARTPKQIAALRAAARFLTHVTVSADSFVVQEVYKSARTISSAKGVLEQFTGPGKSLHIIVMELGERDLAAIQKALVGTETLLEVSPLLPSNLKMRDRWPQIQERFRKDVGCLKSIANLSYRLTAMSNQNGDKLGECVKKRFYVSADGGLRLCPYDHRFVSLLLDNRATIKQEAESLQHSSLKKVPECMIVCNS